MRVYHSVALFFLPSFSQRSSFGVFFTSMCGDDHHHDDDGDDDVYSIAIHILLEHVSFARTSNFQICMSDLLL